MTVIIITEENNGIIGVAKDFESVKAFLINTHWIHAEMELYFGDMKNWDIVCSIFGKDWETKIKKMTLDEFEETFANIFYLFKQEVYSIS